MRSAIPAVVLALAVAVAPAFALEQTATELKKELLPKIKAAQAAGKDLGQAGEEYKAGDEALKQGLQEEALDHFKKAKAAMPADAK
jgi:ERCC4-related helicase